MNILKYEGNPNGYLLAKQGSLCEDLKTIGKIWYKQSEDTLNTGWVPFPPQQYAICTAAPTISGTVASGQVLTSTAGTWSWNGTFSYQWQGSTDGVDWSNLSGNGANTNAYTVQTTDIGSQLRCLVTNKAATSSAIQTLTIPVHLPALTASNVVNLLVLGFAFKLLSTLFSVTNPATTGSKLATLTPGIAGTPVTGGVIALTSANCTPVGAQVAGSAITGANVGTATQGLSFVGSSVTAFIEGDGVLVAQVENLDLANTINSSGSDIPTAATTEILS